MKTAISVPDRVFREVDRVAKRLKVSRSELFTRAVEKMLSTMRDEQITASYDEAFANDSGASDSAVRRSTRAVLLAVEWENE